MQTITANKITLEQGDFGTYLIVAEDGRDLLVQIDYDFPGLAQTFGWDISKVQRAEMEEESQQCGIPLCNHEGTDGTVKCSCGLTASDFIAAASEWLDDNIGAEAEDPGYFDN